MVDNAEWLSDILGVIWMIVHSPWVLIIVIGVIFLDYILETKPLISVVTVIACGIFCGLYEGQWDILLIIGLLLGWAALTFVVNYILVTLFKCEIEIGCLFWLVLLIPLPIALFAKEVLIYWEWWQISVLIGVVLIGLIVLGYFRRRAIARKKDNEQQSKLIDYITKD